MPVFGGAKVALIRRSAVGLAVFNNLPRHTVFDVIILKYVHLKLRTFLW